MFATAVSRKRPRSGLRRTSALRVRKCRMTRIIFGSGTLSSGASEPSCRSLLVGVYRRSREQVPLSIFLGNSVAEEGVVGKAAMKSTSTIPRMDQDKTERTSKHAARLRRCTAAHPSHSFDSAGNGSATRASSLSQKAGVSRYEVGLWIAPMQSDRRTPAPCLPLRRLTLVGETEQRRDAGPHGTRAAADFAQIRSIKFEH